MVLFATLASSSGCGGGGQTDDQVPDGRRSNFGDDVRFLREHTEVIVLEGNSGNALAAVCPEYQGRVMTSSADGPKGISHGWINRDAIAAREHQPHINVFGGEDRFWLGPEGGQYSIFFKKGDPFDLEHWQTPEAIDWGAWEVVERDSATVTFHRRAELTNYSGYRFSFEVTRRVRLIESGSVASLLGAPTGASRVVAFETTNTLTNTGESTWEKETGLLSIWILGMFEPSSGTTVVVPFKPGPVDQLGPIVNDRYFGVVPEERLVVDSNALFFKGDGLFRSKIGVGKARALPTIGSFDAAGEVLTIVQYTLPENANDYVNSLWEVQDRPFSGDVVNSYNDGPPEPGARPLGPFYELETSSPAAELAPGEAITHVHRTFHFQGSRDHLDAIALDKLGVSLDRIEKAFRETP